MAWLNVNVEFGYKFSEYDDWWYPEEDEDENWEEYCKFRREVGASKGFVNFPMSCENYPTKESIRKSAIYNLGLWSFRRHHYPKVKNKTVWKFSQMVIDNYIGKSFNDAFSYYLKHTKGIPDRYNEFLDYNFIGHKPTYYIDDEGLIQKCVYPLSKWQQEWYDNHKPTKLYTFKSADYRTETIHKHTGETLKEAGWKVSLTKRYNISHFVEVLVSGYYVENVQPNSRLEKRLKAEKKQKEKQQRKYWKEERKNKQYSFLTREEEEIKKAKIQDNNVLLKHGFNEESFKGEPYHGRKNKKK